MIGLRQVSGRMLTLMGIVSIAFAGPTTWAQDDVVVVDENEAAPVNMVFNANGAEQVDQLLFGRFGGTGVAHNKLDSALALRIDDVDRVCGATDAQKKKLKLAGSGDIKRFFDRVEEIKRKFQGQNNAQFNNVWQEIQPLQAELNAGLFGEDSIFAKTVKRTLTEEQASKFETVVRQRNLARYQSTVAWCVVQLDRSIGLSEEQRSRLLELLWKETKPPKRLGQNDYWYMMLQASKLPESKIKPIFDNVQWRIVQRQLMQGKAMEQWLKMSGIIDDDQPARAQRAVAAMPAIPLAAPTVTIKRAVPKEKVAAEKKK